MRRGLRPSIALRIVVGARGRSLRGLVPIVAGLSLAAAALTGSLLLADLGPAQSARRTARDGADGSGLPPVAERGAVVRSTRTFTTDEGTVTLTSLGGPDGATIGLPGLDRLPSPGSVLVSNELAVSAAEGELRAWLPGRVTGQLAREATVDPDEAIVISVVSPGEITASGAYSYVDPGQVATAPASEGDRLLAVVGANVVLVPLAGLCAVAVRMTGRRKEKRDATLRLLGTTPRGMRVLVIIETLAASVIATAFGAGAVAAVLASVDHVHLAGRSAWTTDLHLQPTDLALVLAGTAVVAVVSALLGSRGAQVDPVSTHRSATADHVAVGRLGWCFGPVAILAVLWIASPTESQGVLGTTIALLLGALAVVRAGPLTTRWLAAAAPGLGPRLGAAPLLRRAQQACRPVVPVGLVLFGFAVSMTLLPGLTAGGDLGAHRADLVIRGDGIDIASATAVEIETTPGVEAVASTFDTVVAVEGRSTAVTFLAGCEDLDLVDFEIVAGTCRPGAALAPPGVDQSSLTLTADPGAMAPEPRSVYGRRTVSGTVEGTTDVDSDGGLIVIDPTVHTSQPVALIRTDRRPTTLAAIRDLVAADRSLTLLDRTTERVAQERTATRTADQIATIASALLALGAIGTAYAGWGIDLDRRRDHAIVRALGARRAEAAASSLVAFLTPIAAIGTLGAGLGLLVGFVGALATGIAPTTDATSFARGLALSTLVVAATAAALAVAAARHRPAPPDA